jgi:hypothetical protein
MIPNCGIYGLVDSDRGHFVYVGRAFDIDHRFREHMNHAVGEAHQAIRCGHIRYPVIADKRNCLAYLWLEGVPIDLTVIEECPPDVLKQDARERHWGLKLVEEGHPLSNGTKAGTRFDLYAKKPPCPYSDDLPNVMIYGTKSPWDSRCGASIPLDALRNWGRLERQRPDLLDKVRSGDLSPHRAMVDAGFKPQAMTIPADPAAAGHYFARRWPREKFTAMVNAALDAYGVPDAEEAP